MTGFNIDRVNRAITFVLSGEFDLKKTISIMEEAIHANREADKLLRDTGALDDRTFFNNELAYSRTERIILELKHDSRSLLRSSQSLI